MQHPLRILLPALALAWLVLLAFVVAASPEPSNQGEMAFNNNCRTCHSTKAGDNRMGPSLHKIVGAKAGASQGYPLYSQGLKGSGITWDQATLDKFIANPDSVVPSNSMKPYKGVTDAALRAKIIEFLKSGAE